MKIEKSLIITLSCVLGLVGCTPSTDIVYQQTSLKQAPNFKEPTVAAKRDHYLRDLQRQGVQIIFVGETIRFVMLSDELFYPNSANLYSAYYPVLNDIASFMQTYDKVNVQIMAYGDKTQPAQRELALTTRQAQVIESTLWKMGMDARLVIAEGFDGCNPVDWNTNDKGRANNRRVEIVFRYYPHQKSYE